MNNISKLLLGAAALVGLASCSNDEPVVGPEGNGVSTTDIAYLNIKIASPDDVTSRAADDPFGYKDYGKSERIIDNAWFFFYYADGKYANVKTNQFLADTDDQNMPNVEYRSKGTIILKGLTDKQYPSYVVTVLNLPNYDTFEAPSTLAGWTDLTWDNSYSGTDENKRFVMLTSSYYDTNRTTTGADKGNQPVYFATPLVEANFLKEEPKETADDTNRVQIYVERLAARVEVKSGLTGGVTKKVDGVDILMYPANRTVGGEDNGEAETELYVSFDGWDLTTTATKTLAAKSLEGWTAATTFGDKNWKWNDADYFRSYWGKSFVYGKSGDELKAALKMDKTWQDLNQTVGNDEKNSTVAYCNENTNYFENIWGTGKLADPAKATTVLLRATARDKDGNPMDLVEFRGVHYTKEGFINNALSIADMPYAVRTVDQTYTGKNEAGEEETLVTYKYTTLGKEYFELASAKDGVTGSVNVVVKEGTYYLPDATAKTKTLTIGEEKVTITYYDATEVTKATIDNDLKKVHVGENKAIAATGGAMYYPIVIEHLNFTYTDGKKDAEKDIVRDGMIGVVRNHAYTINVTKINGLGKGVFIPTDITGGDKAEPIIPEGPQDPTYYVESTINILSWKLVEQNAEI